MWPENSSFSPELPTLQNSWDATSLKTLKECAFKYYLSNVMGYQPRRKSVHLTFGVVFHDACERYHKFRAEGYDHEAALLAVVSAAYYRQLLTPEEVTLGEGWHEHALPPTDTAKTPHTLLRAIVWYLDQADSDSLQTHILPSGKAAVELSFRFPLEDTDGFTYCGHFDRIAEYNDYLYVTDYKTSKSQLDARFFAQFSPDIQISGYTLASQIVFDMPAKGVIIDAIQLGVTYAQFARQVINRTSSQLEEFLDDLKLDLKIAKFYAEQDSWPLNPTACHHFGGCPFRKVCSHPPSVRQNFLKADFIIRHWNPAASR